MRGFSNFPQFYHDRDVVLWAKAWLRTSPQRCLEIWSFGTGDLSIFSSSDHLSKCRYLAGKRSQRYFDVKISPEYQMWLLRFSFLCVCRSRDVCEEIKANFPEGKVRRDTIYVNALRCCFTIITSSRILASANYHLLLSQFRFRGHSKGFPNTLPLPIHVIKTTDYHCSHCCWSSTRLRVYFLHAFDDGGLRCCGKKDILHLA